MLQPVREITAESIKLRGGALSLDFANSVDWTEDDAPIEAADALVEPDSLDRWGARLGVAGAPGGLEELSRAREFRAALHGIFSTLARGGSPDLGPLQAVYAEAVAAARLTLDGPDWPRSESRRVRFAVAADAVALITDPDRVARLHRCPGRDCGWVFLNTSGRRRWCSMATCGSREKMRRMYARRRAATMGGN